MSLQHYGRLQSESEIQADLLGCVLPQLVAAKLELNSKTLSTEAVREAIGVFDAQHGWLMYRDYLEIGVLAPTRQDFIEGEWNRDDFSLKVKLIAYDQYLVTQYGPGESPGNEQAYATQTVYIRNELQEQTCNKDNAANYRLWWQKASHGKHQGRWMPLAQQFMGFCYAQESK